MKIDIQHQPDSSVAYIQMNPQEEIIAQAGAMVAMSGHMNVSTTLRKGKGGGIMGGLKRLLAGESLFLSVFRSYNSTAEIYLAPTMMGDIVVCPVQGEGWVVQATGYLACTSGVDLDIGFLGLKTLFSGESIFWLRLTGDGIVLLSSFGGIYEVDVDGEYIVDTGHIVAFEKSLDFSIGKANKSWLGAFLGGEGFICRFRGKGKLYCQTHNAGAFGQLVGSRLPPR